MRVRASCVLNCSAGEMWQQVTRPAVLEYVTWPMIVWQPDEPWPEHWEAKDYLSEISLFGVLPFGTQLVGIREVPGTGPIRRLRDDGHGAGGTADRIKQWDHLMEVRPHESDPSRTRYRDTVDVDAGWLTLPLWAYAAVYYHYRQLRWRWLVRTGFRGVAA